MSDRSTSKVAGNSEALAQDSVDAVNGAISSSLKSSSLFGWLVAGTDLFTRKLDSAADIVSKKIDDTQESFQSMQAKGLEVETEIKRAINPFTLAYSAQKFVTSSSLYTFFSGGQKRLQKEKQLELLSTKIDLLVEQVALLAAKQAVEKVTAKKSTAAKAPATSKPRTSTSTTKSAQKRGGVKTSTTKVEPAQTSRTTAATAKTTKARTTKTSTAKGATSASKARVSSKTTSSADKSGTAEVKPNAPRSRASSKQTKAATPVNKQSNVGGGDDTLLKPSGDGTENS